MSLPYLDWELVESKKLSFHDYMIFKVTTAEGDTLYRGWLDTGHWQDDKRIEPVRLNLILIGNSQ